MARFGEFTSSTRQAALERQRHRCGSCGARIDRLGDAGRATHPYGEGAQGHHIRHLKSMGNASLDNCVVLCQACHYSVHEGGSYRFGKLNGRPRDFPYFRG